MLANSNGKLLVYVSGFTSNEKRFDSVSMAAEKMAKMLDLNFEIVTLEENVTPIYVYYKSGDEDPIPLYCDKNGEPTINEVYTVLRNMMFVLSFHPKHSVLTQLRKSVIQSS